MYTHKSKLKNFGKSDVIRIGNWSDTELIRVANAEDVHRDISSQHGKGSWWYVP